MAVVDYETDTAQEVRAHVRSFVGFERFVMFAAAHVALILVSLALAFPGHAPWFGFLLGVGGTLALIVGFVITASNSRT
jgi:hypothetical protein